MADSKESLKQAKANIRKNFPQLEIKSINHISEGMDSQAFLINEDLIFCFPKHQEIIGQLRAEICLLPKLRSQVRFAIPNFEYVGQQQENEYPFVGYKKIHGIGLEKELMLKLDSALRNMLIKEIAVFIQQVHSFSIDTAKQCGVKIADFKKNYTSDLENTRKETYRLLDKDVIDYVEKLHRDYLSDEQNFDYIPVLLNADFSPDHIIYDESKEVVTGVIDFGDIEIGEPETQAILLRMNMDIVPSLMAAIEGNLNDIVSNLKKEACVCVVLASGGYPGNYEKGKVIKGLDNFEDSQDIVVFHAGTKKLENGKMATNGGRVLGISALGKDIKKAIDNAYKAVNLIEFENMYYRKDIGKKALKKYINRIF